MDTIVSRSNDMQPDFTQELPTMNDLPEVPEVESASDSTADMEAQEQQEQSQEEVKSVKAQKSHDASFRELRLKQEETERRLEEAQRYIRDIEARTRQAAAPQDQEPEPSDSDLVEWKHVKKHVRSLQQELAEIKQQSMQQQEESRLRTKYPDIDSVITPDNMAQLRRIDPEAAAAVDQATSLYSKGMLAYRLIKQSNIVDEQEYVPQQKINKNALKPRSVATVNPSRGQNPLDKANSYIEFTDELAKQLAKEMDEAARRR